MPIGTLGELVLIAVVALIVIGPKDLPQALRTLGRAWRSVHLVIFKAQRFFHALTSEAEVQDILASHTKGASSDTPAAPTGQGDEKSGKTLTAPKITAGRIDRGRQNRRHQDQRRPDHGQGK
jgi:Sec-independent protein translocase protein TatA